MKLGSKLSYLTISQVNVGLELKLNAGESAVARYFSGSGTDTLLLEYLVQEGEAVDQLDFIDNYSLVAESTEGGRVPKAGYVRRISTLPSTDADLNLSQIERLSVHDNIEIDGRKPTLIGVSVFESDEGKTFERGDTFGIVVQFSSIVEVDLDNPPLLGLLLGTNMRWAPLLSGNGSSALIFSYTVLLGDACSPLDLKYTQICRNYDCNDLDGLVMRESAASILDADLKQGMVNLSFGSPVFVSFWMLVHLISVAHDSRIFQSRHCNSFCSREGRVHRHVFFPNNNRRIDPNYP